MVKPFQFAKLPLIYFKNGRIADLPGFIHNYGSSVLLVTGRKSFQDSDHGRKLLEELGKKKLRFTIISIPREPSPDDIDGAVKKLRNDSYSSVTAIGGGSVLDAGKAISAMMYREDSVTEYLEGVGKKTHPGNKLPFIAVPTTSGTGSEATKNAVISLVGKNGFKRSLRHENFVPDIALVDPLLTVSCPPEITAASGMDCFTQLTEAYLSDKGNEYTDALAIEGLKAIKKSIRRSCANGDDIEARTGMSFAALTSGICLANAGLGVVHGFASSVGGMYDIPHGLICGTLMAAANEVNIKLLLKGEGNDAPLAKYIVLGRLFTGKESVSDEYYLHAFIDYLHRLTSDLKLKKLKDYGVKVQDYHKIAAQTEPKNNPVKLSTEDLVEILKRH